MGEIIKNGQLRLIRGTEWFGRIRNLHIFIDNKEIGVIGFNDYKDFHLSPGDHEVFVKLDILKSRKMTFNVNVERPSIFRVRLPNDVFDSLRMAITLLDGNNLISFEPVSTDTRTNKF